MAELHMGVAEARFADIIWENEPVSSAQLAKQAGERFGWKKTTAFTVLRRLCDKGLFRNDRGEVTSRLSRAEFYAVQSEQYVKEHFQGSLPAFLAAFTAKKRLRPQEVEELRRIIAAYEEV